MSELPGGAGVVVGVVEDVAGGVAGTRVAAAGVEAAADAAEAEGSLCIGVWAPGEEYHGAVSEGTWCDVAD